MLPTSKSLYGFRLSGILTALILLVLSMPQDESPLLYQGFLLNEYISNPDSSIFHIFQFNSCYTSWGGTTVAAIAIKLLGVAQAGLLLRLIHLFLLIYIFSLLEKKKYIKHRNLQLLWGLLPLIFGGYLFAKGFYNFLFAIDFTVIALVFASVTAFSQIRNATLLVIAALCHPLPVLVSLPVILILRDYKKLLLLLPACIPNVMHLMHSHGTTHWNDYHFTGRLYILITGMPLASAHLYEFAFSSIIVMGTFMFLILQKGFKGNRFILIPALLIFIGLMAPAETAGGGLIPERMFWIAWVITAMYILHRYALKEITVRYIHIFLFLFIGFKMILGCISLQQFNNTCGVGHEAVPANLSVKLWSAENPDRKNGWLLPFSTLQYRKTALLQKQADYQNHFAWYGYYPFTYQNKLLEDELYNDSNLKKIKASKVKYIWTDVNIADPKISLLWSCGAQSVKLYQIER